MEGTLAQPASAQAALLVLCDVCSCQRMIRRLNCVCCMWLLCAVANAETPDQVADKVKNAGNDVQAKLDQAG